MTETWIEDCREAFKDAVAIGHLGLAWDIIEDVKTAGHKEAAEVMAAAMKEATKKNKDDSAGLIEGRGSYKLKKSL